MNELLIPVLILISATAAVVTFLELIKGFNRKLNHKQSSESSDQLKSSKLNCRVGLIKEKKDNSVPDIFSLEICGTIYTPGDCDCSAIKISITDTTDGIRKAKPVQTFIEKWQTKDSNIFCYSADLGRLPDGVTALSDWMVVAGIPVNLLMLPRKGKRNFQLRISILSHQSGEEIACTACDFTYKNTSLGYIDSEENILRAKKMALSLAFAVAAADRKISDREVEVIEDWARKNVTMSKASLKTRCKFNELLGRILAFFPCYNRIHIYKICKKITKNVPIKVRRDILDLCLCVVDTNGTAAANQLTLLKNVADKIGFCREKFRSVTEKILPVSMYEVEDMEISLGIASDMNREQLFQQLTKEYRKWNARVTNRNPEIKTQAEHMLHLIAATRNQYTGRQPL